MLTFGTIVIVGGGCYGSHYIRQLQRARAAGKAEWARLIVVDRDPECGAARLSAADVAGATLVTEEWSRFFSIYLAAAASASAGAGTGSADDTIVPSPMMPHLMYEWLLTRARDRWPHRDVTTEPLPELLPGRWHGVAPDGTQYASFAEWTCPVHCIEPATCPHTRGSRDWSYPIAAQEYVARLQQQGGRIAGPVILHCSHRVYGVGMIDTAAVVAGDATVARAGERSDVDVVVGTVSHCHGAFNLLSIRGA